MELVPVKTEYVVAIGDVVGHDWTWTLVATLYVVFINGSI